MFKKLTNSFAAFSLLFFVGCASIEKPVNLNENLLYTQYSLTAALEVAEGYDNKGKLDPVSKGNIIEIATQASDALKVARALKVQGKPEDSLAAMQQAKAYIAQLEKILAGIK